MGNLQGILEQCPVGQEERGSLPPVARGGRQSSVQAGVQKNWQDTHKGGGGAVKVVVTGCLFVIMLFSVKSMNNTEPSSGQIITPDLQCSESLLDIKCWTELYWKFIVF